MNKFIKTIKNLIFTFIFIVLFSSTVNANERNVYVYSFNLENEHYYNMLVEEVGETKTILSTWCREEGAHMKIYAPQINNLSFSGYLKSIKETGTASDAIYNMADLIAGYTDQQIIDATDEEAKVVMESSYFKKINFEKDTVLMNGNIQYYFEMGEENLYPMTDAYSFRLGRSGDELIILIYNNDKLCYSFAYAKGASNAVQIYNENGFANVQVDTILGDKSVAYMCAEALQHNLCTFPSIIDGVQNSNVQERVFQITGDNAMMVFGAASSVTLTDKLLSYDCYGIYQGLFQIEDGLPQGKYLNLKYSYKNSTANGNLFSFYYPVNKDKCIDIYIRTLKESRLVDAYNDFNFTMYKCLSLDKATLDSYFDNINGIQNISENLDIQNEMENRTATAEGTVSGELYDKITRTDRESIVHNKIIEYAKPIFMFLVFISLLAISFFGIINNQDAKQRVLIKEKLKHILIGVVLFVCASTIIIMARGYLIQTFESIDYAIADTSSTNPLVNNFPYIESFFMKLLGELMDIMVDVIEHVVKIIMIQLVGIKETAASNDMSRLIFGEPVGGDYTLSPFTENEWTRYMYGYNSLLGISIAFLAIALIKIVCELLLFSGSVEKTKETKEQCMRILIAVFMIIAGPYFVRLLLTLFNYLVTLIPLKKSQWDINFEGLGIIGSMANLSYLWIKLKIYMTFVVRKIMITFMLLLTPVVFGMWAISSKTRGVSLWIGELVSNIAMHLSYAMVFMIIHFVLLNNSNAFITLIVITILIRLADFFRDSLQGLMQKWGGIDESGMAEQTINQMKGWTAKTGRFANNLRKGAGRKIAGAANFIDRGQITATGRIFNNAGAIISGNFSSYRSSRTIASNARKLFADKANSLNHTLHRSKENIENKISNTSDPIERKEYNNLFGRAEAGNISKAELKQLKENGGISADIASYCVQNEDYKRYNKAAQAARDKEKNPGGLIGKMQQRSSDKEEERLDRNAQTREKYESAQTKLSDASSGYQMDSKKMDDYNVPSESNLKNDNKQESSTKTKEDISNDSAMAAYTSFLVAKSLHDNGKISEKDFLNVCQKASNNIKNSGGSITFAVKVQKELLDSVEGVEKGKIIKENPTLLREVKSQIETNHTEISNLRANTSISKDNEKDSDNMIKNSIKIKEKFLKTGE